MGIERPFVHGTIGKTDEGVDTYAFDERARLIVQERERLKISENDPTPGGPWTVKFEPTPACDIGCHFCAYEVSNQVQLTAYVEQKRHDREKTIGLQKEAVMETLDQLEEGGNTRGTYWAGGGEPLIWPHITDALLRASEFSDVFLQTNGTHLDKLLGEPKHLGSIKLISISSYAPDEETYEKVTSRARFGVVNRNIKRAIEMRDGHKLNTSINTKILVSPRNYDKLPETVVHFRKLGVDHISIRETQDFNIGGDGPRGESVVLSHDQRLELYKRLKEEYPGDNLLSSFADSLLVVSKAIHPTTHCYSTLHSHFAVVNPDGDVFIGDPETGNPEYSIGNLNEQKWSEIWDSTRHQEVRTKMDEKQKLGLCNFALCRHVKANQAVERVIQSGENIQIYEDAIMKNFGAFM